MKKELKQYRQTLGVQTLFFAGGAARHPSPC